MMGFEADGDIDYRLETKGLELQEIRRGWKLVSPYIHHSPPTLLGHHHGLRPVDIGLWP